MVKTIRYVGLCLLILANLLLLYSFSYTVFRNSKVSEPNEYAVLLLSMDSDAFPRTDYDALFSKMDLASDAIFMRAGASSDTQQNEIAAAIDRIGSKKVILLAWRDTGVYALSAAQTLDGVAAVILLSPPMLGFDGLESFGTHNPNCPVAVFDTPSAFSVSLYERLSGEDATLFEGLREEGIISNAVHISPDGTRYLSRWDIPGPSAVGAEIIAFVPQVQIKIGEFIATYVLESTAAQDLDCRPEVAVTQGIKILALTFLGSGLLLFFASIPRTKAVRAEKTQPVRAEKAQTVPVLEGDGAPAQEIMPARRAYFRSCVYMSMLTALGACLFLAVMIVIYYLKPEIVLRMVSLWPIIYYALCAVFMVRFFPKAIKTLHISVKRLIFSGFLALLVISGIFMLREMHAFSFQLHYSGIRGVAFLLAFAFLFALVWIRIATDSVYLKDANQTASEGRFGSWYRQKFLAIPYVGALVFFAVIGEPGLAVKSGILLAALLISLWVRYIFRKISGADGIAAIVFAVIYTVLSLG